MRCDEVLFIYLWDISWGVARDWCEVLEGFWAICCGQSSCSNKIVSTTGNCTFCLPRPVSRVTGVEAASKVLLLAQQAKVARKSTGKAW